MNGGKIGKGFWDALYHHDWPGNIRELITVLKRVGVIINDIIEGQDIRQIINDSCRKKDYYDVNDEVNGKWDEIKSGRSFWKVVKVPFLDRAMKRSEVKEIIKRGLLETGGKYKELLKLFNLEEKEYKNFMRFLYYNRLKPE